MRRITTACCQSLAPNTATCGWTMLSSLATTRATPRKVTRAVRAAQAGGELGQVDHGGGGTRVNLPGGGSKEQGRAFPLEEGAVALEVARVAREVLARPELGGVDEDAGPHLVGELPPTSHQGQVAFVESAHGWHERNALPGSRELLAAGPHGGDRGDDAASQLPPGRIRAPPRARGCRVALGLGRVAPGAHVCGESLQRTLDRGAQLRVAADEAWQRRLGESHEVGEDQDLTVAVRSCPDANRGDVDRARDRRPEWCGDGLEHQAERPGLLERPRMLDQGQGLLAVSALHAVAANAVQRLGRQPQVAHHGDARRDDRGDLGYAGPSSLTARAPPSATSRTALRTASRTLVW